jgi:hypothetical protein
MSALSPELRTWLVPGLAGTIASVDRQGQPQMTRVWSVRTSQEPEQLVLYVLRAASSGLLEGIQNSGRAALNLIEVATYRSRLFKGTCSVSPDGVDAAFLELNLQALSRAFQGVGMAPDTVERILGHSDAPRDMLALCLSVESVFDQSPKPGAGQQL